MARPEAPHDKRSGWYVLLSSRPPEAMAGDAGLSAQALGLCLPWPPTRTPTDCFSGSSTDPRGVDRLPAFPARPCCGQAPAHPEHSQDQRVSWAGAVWPLPGPVPPSGACQLPCPSPCPSLCPDFGLEASMQTVCGGHVDICPVHEALVPRPTVSPQHAGLVALDPAWPPVAPVARGFLEDCPAGVPTRPQPAWESPRGNPAGSRSPLSPPAVLGPMATTPAPGLGLGEPFAPRGPSAPVSALVPLGSYVGLCSPTRASVGPVAHRVGTREVHVGPVRSPGW